MRLFRPDPASDTRKFLLPKYPLPFTSIDFGMVLACSVSGILFIEASRPGIADKVVEGLAKCPPEKRTENFAM